MKLDGVRIKCPKCACKVFKIFEKDNEKKVNCRACGETVIKVEAEDEHKGID